MAPCVLLVHANPAVTATPVPPYGIERIARALGLAGCDVRLCCPFVEEDPLGALRAALAVRPDLVGIGVRNVDDALIVRSAEGPGALDLAFALDAVAPLVRAAVDAVGPDRVLLGGAAFSAGGAAICRHLGARWALAGPADDLAWRIGRALVHGAEVLLPEDPRVLRADAEVVVRLPDGWRQPPGPTPRHGGWLALARARGGRVPVQVATGCDRGCWHCVEPCATGGRVALRPVEEVVTEVEALARAGIRRVWLACSELNVPDARHATTVLGALAGRGLDLSAYLAPAPVDDALLDAIEDAGVDPSDLSFEFGHLDPGILACGGGPAPRAALDRLVDLWLRRGYRALGGCAIFGGHPAETEESLTGALDAALAIDRALPDGFGLAYACGARVYPGTPLARRLGPASADLWTADGEAPDPTFVRPVVHCRPLAPRALLARVRAALTGARGAMGPMNAAAPDAPGAELLVTRGLLRLHDGRDGEAAACFEAALETAPAHLEALAQLAQVRANRLGDPEGARQALRRLEAALPPGDGRRAEVLAALAAL